MNPRDDLPRHALTTADLASLAATADDRLAVADHERRLMEHGDAALALFPPEELHRLRSQWVDIQADFVVEPRRSVQDADRLVAATIQRLADSFAGERSVLEAEWGRGGDVSTEDLRVALRRYRAFFERLLTI